MPVVVSVELGAGERRGDPLDVASEIAARVALRLRASSVVLDRGDAAVRASAVRIAGGVRHAEMVSAVGFDAEQRREQEEIDAEVAVSAATIRTVDAGVAVLEQQAQVLNAREERLGRREAAVGARERWLTRREAGLDWRERALDEWEQRLQERERLADQREIEAQLATWDDGAVGR